MILDTAALISKSWPLLMAAALAMARPVGLLVINPVWARLNLTGLLRGAVAFALALPAIPNLVTKVEAENLSGLALLLLSAKEATIGAALGFLLGLPFWSFQFAGDVLDQQRGATSGRINDPAGFEDVSITGSLLLVTGITLFVTTGGLQALAGLLYASWSVWPVLAPLPRPTDQASALVLRFLEAVARQGVLVALPLVLAMLLSDVAMSLIGRFAPQLRVEDASPAARNLVFSIVLAIYCALLATYLKREVLLDPGFLDQVRRVIQ